VSLLTESQASKVKDMARARGEVALTSTRLQAQRAAAAARPMTASARTAARKGIHRTRAWAAPRLERTGHTLEDQVAPKMAAMLSAAAQRIEPAPVRRRRRWLVLAAGLITAAGLSATAAYVLKRRSTGTTPEDTDSAASSTPTKSASPADTSEANGQGAADLASKGGGEFRRGNR
jgi:hypothetical protein